MAEAARIYIADTRALNDDALYERVYRSVGEARRRKTDRLRFRKDRNLSLGVEYLLRQACSEFGLDPDAQTVVADEGGKPYFAGRPVEFNLSHSGERVMCVMAPVPAGCDTEERRQASRQVAARFFSADEYALIEAQTSHAARQAMFCRLWTLKESFMKCTGLGLRLPLNDFSVVLRDGAVSVRQSVSPSVFRFYEYDCGDGYHYACCLADSDKDAIPVWNTVTVC